MEPASVGGQAGALRGLGPHPWGEDDGGRLPSASALDLDGAIALGQALVTNLGRVVLGTRAPWSPPPSPLCPAGTC